MQISTTQLASIPRTPFYINVETSTSISPSTVTEARNLGRDGVSVKTSSSLTGGGGKRIFHHTSGTIGRVDDRTMIVIMGGHGADFPPSSSIKTNIPKTT